MMKTRMTEILEIDYPILQGAMAWISRPELVAAVSNAGAAGILTTNWGADQLREDIRTIKKLTNKPFGVNTNHGLRNTEERDELIRIIIEEKVPFVTMGAGDQRPYIPVFQGGGVKTICIVPSTRLAKRIEEAGADMLIIEGMEAGGRIGTLTTMALMTNVIPEVKIPVLAAGSIVDGRGMAAAMIMGAAGIQMGSRFLLAAECGAYHSDNIRQIIAATDDDCTTIGLSRGKGMRGLKSPFSEKYTRMEIDGVPTNQLNELAADISLKVAKEGIGPDGMNGIVQVGQGVGPLRNIQSAREIVTEVIMEAEDLLRTAPLLV